MSWIKYHRYWVERYVTEFARDVKAYIMETFDDDVKTRDGLIDDIESAVENCREGMMSNLDAVDYILWTARAAQEIANRKELKPDDDRQREDQQDS